MSADWNTDLRSAPKGESVLVAVRSLGPSGECLTQIGILLWEEYEQEPDETDDDIEGYWGEHNGKMGIWYWHADYEGYTDKKDLAAWRPMPPCFRKTPAGIATRER